MKGLVIKSTALVGFPIAAFLACSSENLQTTGLEPSTFMPQEQPVMPLTPGQMVAPGTTTPPPAATGNDNDMEGGNQPDQVIGTEPPPSNGNTDPMTTPDPDEMTDPDDQVTPPPEVPLTPAAIGGELEGFLHTAPCDSQDFGHDCTLPGCQGGSKTTEIDIDVGGEVGKTYDVTVHVYGVVEPRLYQGGERRAGTVFNANGLDFWHVGGQVPGNPGTYNSFELRVDPPVAGAANVYFLNSRTGGDQQIVVRLDYTATFPISGGGRIQFRSFDLNCRQITNCSTQECGPVGPKPVVTDAVRNASPPPPASFTQPYGTAANLGRGQWVYIDVTDVALRP